MTNGESDTAIYLVTHAAFKSEVVIASSEDEAKDNAAGGYDRGDYTYGHTSTLDKLGPVCDLKKLDGIGNGTVHQLLEADAPLGLGPGSDLPLRQRDETRLKNQVEENRRVLE